MINNNKSFFKVYEYNIIKFIIIYIGEPLFNKTCKCSLTWVLFPKTILVAVKEIVSVSVQEQVFVDVFLEWF